METKFFIIVLTLFIVILLSPFLLNNYKFFVYIIEFVLGYNLGKYLHKILKENN